jgi:RNA 3'-terminal phosphate cyclase (ATP)
MPVACETLVIDGSYGEGGGQILRTALSLSVLLGRPFRMESIRKSRRSPGLAAQHLTAVRAAAALCRARVDGDELGSSTLEFDPGMRPAPGSYRFDVGAAREGGSAGAATLVLQTVLLPLASASGSSQVTVVGGTHMDWSPPYDYLAEIWLPELRRLGLRAELELRRSGWFPVGRGEILATIEGHGRNLIGGLSETETVAPGRLVRIRGRAIAANLPSHIPDRMVARTRERLRTAGVPVDVAPVTTEAACAGEGLFLIAEHENCRAGFSAFGKRGKPAEAVADEAIDRLLAFTRSGAAFDCFLADQMLLPLAFAGRASRFTTETVSLHLVTNAWVIEAFGLARIRWRQGEGGPGYVEVKPFPG